MYIATLFTIAKICNQPTCPYKANWMKKIQHGIQYSHEEEQHQVFCSSMDVAEGHYPKRINAESEKQILCVLTCEWKLNIGYSWT